MSAPNHRAPTDIPQKIIGNISTMNWPIILYRTSRSMPNVDQFRSMVISDQCHEFDRHWSALIEGVLYRIIGQFIDEMKDIFGSIIGHHRCIFRGFVGHFQRNCKTNSFKYIIIGQIWDNEPNYRIKSCHSFHVSYNSAPFFCKLPEIFLIKINLNMYRKN